jgi:transcriptional regulator with XRE-family HTH domain
MTKETLKAIRTIHGFSQKEFAAIIGLAFENLCRIEKGTYKISAKTERSVHEKLNVDEELLQMIDRIGERRNQIIGA